MNPAQKIYASTEKFPTFETLGNYATSGDPSYAHAAIALDFGDGGIVDGQMQPGIANEGIAEYLYNHYIDHDTGEPIVQINAQLLAGNALKELCRQRHSRELEEGELFRIVGKPAKPSDSTKPLSDSYVGSWQVACESRENIPWARVGELLSEELQARKNQGLPRGVIAVVAAEPHAARARSQVEKAFAGSAEVYVPKGQFDGYAGNNSTQRWTRNVLWWKPFNALAWTLSTIKGGPMLSKEDVKALPSLTASWMRKKFGEMVAALKNDFTQNW